MNHYKPEHRPVITMMRRTHFKDFVTIKEVKTVMSSVLDIPMNSHLASKIVREYFKLPRPKEHYNQRILTPQIGHTYMPIHSCQVIFGLGWKREFENQITEIMKDPNIINYDKTIEINPLATVAGRNDPNRKRRNRFLIQQNIPGDCERIWEAMKNDASEFPFWIGNPVTEYDYLMKETESSGPVEYRIRIMRQANMIRQISRGRYRIILPEFWNHNLLNYYKTKGDIHDHSQQPASV